MGGDHKCPVCQATFTRPQHVARHMRSHTGDRPYKCQYCGDQFARSDLLSRHVNKCHANEKPLPNPGGPRRKGAASATRATTSKQACDQCVQSSLPCDGCNPCAKCVSRKCRCTYVKFHRQTAPVGPGHNTRPNASPASVPAPASGSSMPSSAAFPSTSSSRLPLYHHSEDDFILGPAPAVPTMAETLCNSNSFGFPPLYPQNSDLNSLHDSPSDYAAKYRVQHAELFDPSRSMNDGLTPLFDARQGGQNSWLASWENQDPHDAFGHEQQQGHRQLEILPEQASPASMHDKYPQAELAPHSNNFINHSNPESTTDNAPISIVLPYPPGFVPRLHNLSRHQHGRNSSSSYDSSNSNSRRGSVDFSGSEGGHTSGSMPSSATSSNVHLPLGGGPVGYGNTGSQQRGFERYECQDDRQEFSSAFGLMSLDDPAVMAGLAVDGQPFFDDPSQAHNHHSSNAEHETDGLLTTDVGPDVDTPMPLKRDAVHIQLPSINQRPVTANGAPGGPGVGGAGTTFGIGNLPTPSKDSDTRELKEFWKQYMRTPLSGPQDAGSAGGSIGSSNANSKNPSPIVHRRQRVASLPSAKTPMVERAEIFAQHPPGYEHHTGHQQDQRGRETSVAAAMQQGLTSSLRTTLHAKEDLSSYEAAVMARKAPTLNLQLKRPMKGKNPTSAYGQQQQEQSSRGESRIVKGNHPNAGFACRPPSFTNSSSLAHAFSERGSSTVSVASSQSMSGREESVSPLSSSRDTSVDAGSTSASSDLETRPTFKRLASQTLGPDNPKRAFFGYGDDTVERERDAGWSVGVPDVKRVQLTRFGGISGSGRVIPESPAVSIAERRKRRMSAPTSSVDEYGQARGDAVQQ